MSNDNLIENPFMKGDVMSKALEALEKASADIVTSLKSEKFDSDEVLDWESDAIVHAALDIKALIERELGDAGFSTRSNIENMHWELHIYEEEKGPLVDFSK